MLLCNLITCGETSRNLEGGAELFIWEGGWTVHTCGFNSRFARLSSIKSHRYWRAKRARRSMAVLLRPFVRLQRHLVAFFQPLHTAHSSLFRSQQPFFWCPIQAFFHCNLLSYYLTKKTSTHPFLNSLSSEESSEQICRACPHISAV